MLSSWKGSSDDDELLAVGPAGVEFSAVVARAGVVKSFSSTELLRLLSCAAALRELAA